MTLLAIAGLRVHIGQQEILRGISLDCAAGEVLGVNHSTVSRRIAALESAMGGRVLVRTTGGWEVTDLGRRAVAIAERIEASLRELVEGEGADAVHGMVRISAPDAFTSVFLAPAVTALGTATKPVASSA